MAAKGSTNDTDSEIVHLMMSEEYFASMWLHVLLLVGVMAMGMPGNSLIIAVFFRKQRQKQYNSTQLLVFALAVTDLSVCCLLVPYDLHKLRHFFSLQVEPMCNVFEYFRATANSLSCFLLTSMAVERYRAICSSTILLQGHSCKGTLVIIIVLIISAVIMSSPCVFFMGIQDRQVPLLLVRKFSSQVQDKYNEFSGRVLMYSCEYLDKHDHTLGLRAFGLTSLMCFLGLVSASTISYGMIYRKIRKNHISLRLALNRVAPAPPSPAPQLRHPDGHNTLISSSGGNPAADRISSDTARRLPSFTLPSSHWLSDGHGTLKTARCSGRRREPVETGPCDNQNGTGQMVMGKLSPDISESVSFSDEKDINVSVENRDDILPAPRSQRRSSTITNFLRKVRSVMSVPQLIDLNRHRTVRAKVSSEELPSRVESNAGTDVSVPRFKNDAVNCVHSRSQPAWSVPSDHRYDIFLVSGGKPGSPHLQGRESQRKYNRQMDKKGHASSNPARDVVSSQRVDRACRRPHNIGIRLNTNQPSKSSWELKMESSQNFPDLNSEDAKNGCHCSRLFPYRRSSSHWINFPATLAHTRDSEQTSVDIEQHHNEHGTWHKIALSANRRKSFSTAFASQSDILTTNPQEHAPLAIPACPDIAHSDEILTGSSLDINTDKKSPKTLIPSHSPVSLLPAEPRAGTHRSIHPKIKPTSSARSCIDGSDSRGDLISSCLAVLPAMSARTNIQPTMDKFNNAHSLRFARQIRVAKILLAVTGAFLLSFLPFWVLTFVYMAWPHLDWEISLNHRMFLSALFQSYFINNAINPVLFAMYSPEFRKESRNLLKSIKNKLCHH